VKTYDLPCPSPWRGAALEQALQPPDIRHIASPA
jgi:hypothetical protein